MKESVIDKILSSTGYLPPRNEEEMDAFEKIFSEVVIKENFHVDVDRIVDGGCCVKHAIHSLGGQTMSSNDMRMAARNFESLPSAVIDKIKKQHKSKNDKGE